MRSYRFRVNLDVPRGAAAIRRFETALSAAAHNAGYERDCASEVTLHIFTREKTVRATSTTEIADNIMARLCAVSDCALSDLKITVAAAGPGERPYVDFKITEEE